MKISIFGFSNFTNNCKSAQCLTKNFGVYVLSFLHSKLLFKSIVVTQFHENKYFLGFEFHKKLYVCPMSYKNVGVCVLSFLHSKLLFKSIVVTQFHENKYFLGFEFYKKLYVCPMSNKKCGSMCFVLLAF